MMGCRSELRGRDPFLERAPAAPKMRAPGVRCADIAWSLTQGAMEATASNSDESTGPPGWSRSCFTPRGCADLVQRAAALVDHHARRVPISSAWHFSLQHEAIHSFRGVPAWLRFAVVFPPIGLWFPFPLYRKSHTTHHRDINLTVPGVDTESYYVRAGRLGAHGNSPARAADIQSDPGRADC